MRTIRTAKNRKRFVPAIADSGNINAACEAARLSRAAMYEWRADDPSFAAEWDAALELGLDSLEDELMRRAKDGTLRPVFQGGELVGQIREYSDTLGIFMLKSRRRQVYGDRQVVERRISLEAKITAMSPEERRQRLIELQAKAALLIDGEAVEVEPEPDDD